MRQFDSGATRDTDEGKLDYEGFLSPVVLERYAEYMDKHSIQADGKRRASDNWQKGIPRSAYMKSMWRHFFDVWKLHRQGEQADSLTMEEALCALLFNVMGYLRQELVINNSAQRSTVLRTGQTAPTSDSKVEGYSPCCLDGLPQDDTCEFECPHRDEDCIFP